MTRFCQWKFSRSLKIPWLSVCLLSYLWHTDRMISLTHLDFLKVLPFSFPVPVVGPGAMNFIPCSGPNWPDKFSSCRFYPITNGFTDAPSIKPDHATWNVTWSLELCIFCGFYFDFVLSPVFKYKAVVGVLCSSIGVLYQGRIFLAATERKNITDLFCFERAHYKVFIFLCFLSWRMQTLQRARNVCRLSSQISQDGTFVHYPFFVLNIPLFTFSFRNFFPLFVCFEILWQLATTHARDNTRDRDANSTRQNDVTWCDFLQGKQIKLSLPRSLLQHFAAENIKIYRSRFALVKKTELDL